MKILVVGQDIPHRFTVVEPFNSPVSFLDYEFLVWNPARLFYEYETDFEYSKYKGYRNLNDDDSARITEDIARRKSEILELINLGRTVVIFLPPPDKCYYATGETTFSGTGRSRVTQRIVNSLELYSIIPVKNLIATAAEGKNVDFRGGEPFRTYWTKVKDIHYYSAYLTNPIGKPFLFVKGTTKAIGTWIPTQKGVLLLLPPIYPEEYCKTKKDFSSFCTVFIEALIELSNNLRKETGDFQLPDWAKRILLPGELKQRQDIQHKEVKISKALSEVSKLKEQLANTERYKLLLSGSGRALEIQVAEVLKEIGFTVEDPSEGRDDLILKYDGRVAVAEIKGVTKSAAEKHAAQLEKWVSEYLSQNDIKPKGILIVNAYNNTPLEARSEPVFPDQMTIYSTNREHCLITTTQLLCISLFLRENPTQRNTIISDLLSTSGVYTKFVEYNTWLKIEGTPEKRLESKQKREN
jgi:hypothetical protein